MSSTTRLSVRRVQRPLRPGHWQASCHGELPSRQDLVSMRPLPCRLSSETRSVHSLDMSKRNRCGQEMTTDPFLLYQSSYPNGRWAYLVALENHCSRP